MKTLAVRNPAGGRRDARKPTRATRQRGTQAHESQADRTALAFMAGGVGLAGGLTAAPAAGWQASGSPGRALPSVLRGQLEQAFGAELGGVRIHADAVAAGAAADFGAQAFASGRHIYFGAGRYQPHTGGGQRLIAHEVAHVLQQTGRAASQGRRHAAQVQGTGHVQCEDDPSADKLVPFLAEPALALKTLGDRHSAAPGADESLKELMTLVEDESGGMLPHESDSTIGKRLIQIANDGGFEVTDATGATQTVALTTASSGYLIDALKVCGQEAHFEAAAKLLDADKNFAVRSTFGPRTTFRSYLRDMRGEDWVAAAFKHPALAAFWPARFFNVFEQYVFNPGRVRQTLYGFKEAHDKALKNIDGTEAALINSDRVVRAWELLNAYDQRRLSIFRQLDELQEKHGADLAKPIQRIRTTSVLADWLARKAKEPDSETWRGTLERMSKTAGEAAAYWDRVQALMADTFAGKTGPVALTDARFEPLAQLLRGLALPSGLYGLDAAGQLSVPSAADYGKRQGTLARALGVAESNPEGNQLLVLQTDLIAQYHATNALESPLAAATGFAILWLLEFQPTLRAYKASEDDDVKAGHSDRRLAHRIDVAQAVYRFAQAVGWADVQADAARVLLGDDVARSYLLVRDGWRIDEGVGLEKMVEDFGNKHVSPTSPFTADNVARFFHADVVRKMSDAVMAQVDKVYADPKAKLDAEQINKAIREAGKPWRVVPRGAELVLKPSEMQPVNGKPNPNAPTVFNLIDASKKTDAEFNRLARMQHLQFPYSWIAKDDLTLPPFVWILPHIDTLVAHMRPVEPFLTAVPDTSLTDAQWLAALMKVMDANQLTAAIDKHMLDYQTSEESGAELALREFTILLRREHRATVGAMLKRYAGDRSVTNFELPRKSVHKIDWFYVETRPEVDAGAQQALLVLSLGDELEKAFPAVRHAARIPPLFHYTLTQAVKFADNELTKAEAGDATFRRALKPLLFTNVKGSASAKLKAPDEQFNDFLVHRQQIQELADRVEQARVEMQESSGFLSDDGVTLKTLGYSSRFEPGRKNAVEIDGDEWELVEVKRKFTYHPPLTGSAVTDQSAKPVLKDGKDNVLPIDDRVIATFLVNGIERELRANDTPAMAKFSEALFYWGLGKSMEELAGALEEGAMFLIDVIELIPGVGQELMLARLAAQTGVFIGVELPTITEALKKDPVDYIKQTALNLMDKYLTVEGFIKFVMLGSPSPLDGMRKPAADKQSRTNRPHGKLGRLLAMLRKLGMRIADAMQWLQLRVSGPVRSLQSTVATRPKLGWLLRKSVDIALWAKEVLPPVGTQPGDEKKRILAVLAELLPEGAAQMPAGGKDEDNETFARGLLASIEAEVRQSGTEFKEQFEARLQLLSELKLPGEIIPLESLMALIIEFFLARLGTKVRIAKSLLQHTAPYQKLLGAISGALADAARGTNVDPNKFWRELVLDKLEGRFAEARNGLVDAIYGLTDRAAIETGISAFKLERPPAKKAADLGIERLPFPADEIELSPEEPRVHGAVPTSGRLAELPTSAGQPLAVRVRRVQEAQFGHDFGHVRVHAEASTGQALSQMHAKAATSGSHVFLRPGLEAERGDGARLLRHELTHVLQQAGARPLGRKHATRPVKGRAGAGLTLDSMREAAAEAMSQADNQVAREPVGVMEGAEGVQPSLEDTAVDMLKLFTEIHGAEEFERAADPKDKMQTVAAVQLLVEVRKRLNEKRNEDFLAFAWPVATHIAKHVADTDFQADMPKVAAMAEKPVKGARGKKPKMELDFGRLVTLMEAVLFARTGIAMQIKATEGKPPKISGLTVTYIHLGWILPGTPGKVPLWDEVLANSPKVVGTDDPKLVRQELYTRLQAMGPDPFIWKTGTGAYRFSDDFAEAYGKWRATRKPDLAKNLSVKGPAPPADIKTVPQFKNEYLNPTSQSGIGLRIGLHGGHSQQPTGESALEKQSGTDRESHHMIQYLLVQFFRNDNKIKAWPSGVNYKGVMRKGGEVIDYQGATAGTLHLRKLDLGGKGKRGSAMPAILISSDAHRRGQVHVEKESQWSGDEGDPDSGDGQGRATQGYAIRNEFRKHQRALLQMDDENPGWAAAVQKPNAQDHLHRAMVRTYHWMYDRMMRQLESALKGRERAYYRAVAARLPGALNPATGKLDAKYDLTTSDMAAVFARAKNYTNEVMTAAGWPTP